MDYSHSYQSKEATFWHHLVVPYARYKYNWTHVLSLKLLRCWVVGVFLHSSDRIVQTSNTQHKTLHQLCNRSVVLAWTTCSRLSFYNLFLRINFLHSSNLPERHVWLSFVKLIWSRRIASLLSVILKPKPKLGSARRQSSELKGTLDAMRTWGWIVE